MLSPEHKVETVAEASALGLVLPAPVSVRNSWRERASSGSRPCTAEVIVREPRPLVTDRKIDCCGGWYSGCGAEP